MPVRDVVKLVVGLALLATLMACNTVAGVGEDINAAGRGISRTADNTKARM